MATEYQTWGAEEIDSGSHDQMKLSCGVAPAVAGALMPDAHVGYGAPIGAVVALDNAVWPYGVGVDIACRMMLSIYELSDDNPEKLIKRKNDKLSEILEENTVFGMGKPHHIPVPPTHPLFQNGLWGHPVLTEYRQTALNQLGTSGTGNHFVEWGLLTNKTDYVSPNLNLKAGEYLALLSHSGSRRVGAAVCQHFTSIAKALSPELGDYAYIPMDMAEGQDYWALMNLMGEYAEANHNRIHELMTHELNKVKAIRQHHKIQNHHNFAWLETHKGREVYVHRKGATPAGKGVLGIIPGSMGTPAFLVAGKGNEDSICSASHGAGRKFSRKKAKEKFSYQAHVGHLLKQGVRVLSAKADEVCGAYKDIHRVIEAQSDLVDVVAAFQPKIVKMNGNNDRAED